MHSKSGPMGGVVTTIGGTSGEGGGGWVEEECTQTSCHLNT